MVWVVDMLGLECDKNLVNGSSLVSLPTQDVYSHHQDDMNHV